MMEDLAAAYVGLSVTTIHARQKAGDFPMPVALTPGRKVYLRDDLDAYLDRKAGRSEGSTNRSLEADAAAEWDAVLSGAN